MSTLLSSFVCSSRDQANHVLSIRPDVFVVNFELSCISLIILSPLFSHSWGFLFLFKRSVSQLSGFSITLC